MSEHRHRHHPDERPTARGAGRAGKQWLAIVFVVFLLLFRDFLRHWVNLCSKERRMRNRSSR